MWRYHDVPMPRVPRAVNRAVVPSLLLVRRQQDAALGGQLLTGSLMDYCLPRADHLPNFETATTTTLCTHNSLGVKGCGEAGAIGSTPAVINAVVDALSELNVTDVPIPATPERVWRAIRAAQAA